MIKACLIHAQVDTRAQYAPVGKLVDIGGWKLHIHGDGLHHKQGPTVIFENGIRGFSFDWIPIQKKLSSFTKSYSYDRAGYAWSELGSRPHTMIQSVYNLHTLLKNANIPPPYIMVGASHGGLLVRLFAQKYPSEVAGMILVDAGFEDGIQYINGKKQRPSVDATDKIIPDVKTTATSEENSYARSPEAIKAIGGALKSMGFPFTQVEFPFNQLPDSIQKLRIWGISQYEFYVANENEFIFEEKVGMIKEREKRPYMFGDMPLVVLTAGNSSLDADEQERRINQTAMTNLSRNSKQIIADSNHHIHIEQPELVINAIKEVIQSARTKQRLKK